MAAEPPGLRALLRSQQVFPAGMPEFDPAAAPDDPVTLFMDWLEAAIGDAVPAPHAMTLATADDQGRPSSRVLICKDIDGDGRWYFASGAASGKGRDLAVNPHAAVSFWWPQQGRQIRIRGQTVPAGKQASAAGLSALLTATTIVPRLPLAPAVTALGAAIAVLAACATLIAIRTRPAPAPATADRRTWTMPPIESLRPPARSAWRTLGLVILRCYLIAAIIVLAVRAIQVALGAG